MKKCPNCQSMNDDKKMFCPGCGEDLSEVPATGVATAAAADPGLLPEPDPAAPAQSAVATQVAPQSSGDAVCTVTWPGDGNTGERSIPLPAGGTITIGREGVGTWNLAIPSGDVPRKPVEISDLGNGRLSIQDTGSSQGFFIAKKVNPGESGEINLDNGEYLICGEVFVFFQ